MTDLLLLLILIVLLADYLKTSETYKKVRRNMPYWLRTKINELRTRRG